MLRILVRLGAVAVAVSASLWLTVASARAAPNLFTHHRLSFPVRGQLVSAHLVILHDDPLRHFSIAEPVGGCNHGRATVSASARHHGCAAAMNAGFFAIDQSAGYCLNAVITDSLLVQRDAPLPALERENAHFGLAETGEFFAGYIDDSRIEAHMNGTRRFAQLVGGVGHIVKDGANHAAASWEREEDQRTPIPADDFASMRAARTALGHDRHGRLLMATIDGASRVHGVSLTDFADILVQMGFVNGVNTDGGGSATLVIHGEVVNQPSEHACKMDGEAVLVNLTTPEWLVCERPVTTIACIREHALTTDTTQSNTVSFVLAALIMLALVLAATRLRRRWAPNTKRRSSSCTLRSAIAVERGSETIALMDTDADTAQHSDLELALSTETSPAFAAVSVSVSQPAPVLVPTAAGSGDPDFAPTMA